MRCVLSCALLRHLLPPQPLLCLLNQQLSPARRPCSMRLAGLWHSPVPCRLLDPQLSTSYPSAILARERAIVVNLEFVKAIIAMGGCMVVCVCVWPVHRREWAVSRS